MDRGTTFWLEAATDRIFRMAFAFPLLLVAAFILGALAAHAEAEPSSGSRDASSSCGRDMRTTLDPDAKTRIAEALAETPAGRGLYWRIEKEGVEPSYLVGTIHLDDPRVARIAEPVASLLDDADRTILELSEIAQPEALAASILTRSDLVMLPGDETLSTILDADEYAAVSRGLEERGIPVSAMSKLQPWFISASLAAPDCEAIASHGAAGGLDGAIARRALENGQPIIGLETLDEQIETLASLPIETQIDQLVGSIESLGDVNDMMETMIGIYRDEEIGALMPTLEALYPEAEAMVGGGEAFSSFETALVDDRNKRMADRLEPYIRKGNSFVGVGALHLIGETGIVQELRRDGWTVERVDISSAP